MTIKSAPSAFAFGLLLLGLAPSPGNPATASTSFGVTAMVQAGCLISATTGALGAYTAAMANPTSSVSVTCTNPSPYSVSLSADLAAGTTMTTRKMTGRGWALLGDARVSNPPGNFDWGRKVGIDTISGARIGSSQALSVQPETLEGQYVAAGIETGTITFTITY